MTNDDALPDFALRVQTDVADYVAWHQMLGLRNRAHVTRVVKGKRKCMSIGNNKEGLQRSGRCCSFFEMWMVCVYPAVLMPSIRR